MLPAGSDGCKQCQSNAIYSPDGERLELVGPVVTEGRPEEWLSSVEAAMFKATKTRLLEVLEKSKGRLTPHSCSCAWTALSDARMYDD
jgi:dynein heavy chain